jgi:glycosyltransferase involved in cell wall biosynthesis
MNRGVEASQGEYVGVFGDDDRWHPKKIDRQIRAFNRLDDDYCCVYTEGVITDGEGTVQEYVSTGAAGDVYPDVLVRMSILPHSGQLVRRECFEVVGGFDTDFDISCDWDLTVRLAERWKFAFLPEVLVERTHHDDNVTGDPEYDRRAREAMRKKHGARIEAAGIEDAFTAAERRESGLLALSQDQRATAFVEFLKAIRHQPTGNHVGLAVLSLMEQSRLETVRDIRDVVLGDDTPDFELPTEALKKVPSA